MGAKGVKKALWVEVLKSNGAPIRPGPLYSIVMFKIDDFSIDSFQWSHDSFSVSPVISYKS